MQDIVKQIVDMDRKAREITAAVEQDRLNSEKEIAQKRVELRAEYLAKAREAIPSSESQERAAAGEYCCEKTQIYHENWTSFTAKRVTNGLITSLHK